MSLAGRQSRYMNSPGAVQCSRIPAEPVTRSVTPASPASDTILVASADRSAQVAGLVAAISGTDSFAVLPGIRSFDRYLLERQTDVDALPPTVRPDPDVPGGTDHHRGDGDPELDRHLRRLDQRSGRDRVVP